MQDNRPGVGKLDPRAIKSVFVGYSATQKGYVCWSPIERRLFVSMDVIFREHEPSLLGYPHILETRSILEVYGEKGRVVVVSRF
jgi:hypothetical protein